MSKIYTTDRISFWISAFGQPTKPVYLKGQGRNQATVEMDGDGKLTFAPLNDSEPGGLCMILSHIIIIMQDTTIIMPFNPPPYTECFFEMSHVVDNSLCYTYQSRGLYIWADRQTGTVYGKVCEYMKVHFVYAELCPFRQACWAHRIGILSTQYIYTFRIERVHTG